MFTVLLALCLPASLPAQTRADRAVAVTDTETALPSYRLWPDRAPQARSDAPAERPSLTIYRPPDGWTNGTAVVIAPGGGYIGLSKVLEGSEPAQWFTSRGITAFVLTYRVSPTMLPAPLLDGARAIRLVRAHSAEFGIDPARIGMMGFSAGGHLAAMTAVTADAGDPSSPDPIERVSSRPDFVVLAYPWLEATVRDSRGKSPYCEFSRKLATVACKDESYTQLAPADLVRAGTPPTFLYHTTNDMLVPGDGSARYYLALRRAGVPAELHEFEQGDHGSGMGGSNPSLSQWPMLLQEWLRHRKMLPPPGKGQAYP